MRRWVWVGVVVCWSLQLLLAVPVRAVFADTPELTETETAVPTDTLTPEPTATVTAEPTATVTAEPTATATDTPTPTIVPGVSGGDFVVYVDAFRGLDRYWSLGVGALLVVILMGLAVRAANARGRV